MPVRVSRTIRGRRRSRSSPIPRRRRHSTSSRSALPNIRTARPRWCCRSRAFGEGQRWSLSGPGIADRASLAADPLPDDLGERLAANRALFPRGVDLILVAAGCRRGAAALASCSQRGLTMYVAVKGGERAIENAHALLARRAARRPVRRRDRRSTQIDEQLALAVDRVMSEGSLYDRELAALAIKQARGDLIEAIFLLRAYRTTLPRFGASEPVDTADDGRSRRRISATFKDLPGGQVLGPTFDYTHRLLDHALAGGRRRRRAGRRRRADAAPMPRVTDLLARERSDRALAGERDGGEVGDLTREPLDFPGRPRSAPADPGPRRRRLPAGARLFDPARLWPQPSLRRRDPLRRGRGRVRRRGARLRRAARPHRRHRMPDGQPVHRLRDRAAALHPRLRPRLRPERAQGDVDGAGRPRAARARARRGGRARRRRTRNSSSRIPTTCRRPASSSI